jgi:pyruvate/2-oxoglutarate dehydrogenase complex dihydrolipoamide acyltransferase (E2) component
MNPLRRKLILATWRAPQEGNIHGKLTVDCTKALAYIEYLRQQHDEKITITHFVGRAIGEALHRTPSLNGYIRFGRYIPHDTVSISFLVAIDNGRNLGNTKITDVQKKKIVELSKELRSGALSIRKGTDKSFEAAQRTLKLMPVFVMRPMLWLTGWLTSSLGLNMTALGLNKFPFGACMITSVGMFGLDEGYAPHTPFARVPILVLISAIQKKPVVIDDQVVIRPMMNITATIDHRYIDGSQGATLAHTIREAFEQPWILDGLDSAPEGWDHD